jgi:uncharacterized membrane protein
MNTELNEILTKIVYYLFGIFFITGIVVAIRIFIGKVFGK